MAGNRCYSRPYGVKMHEGKSGEFYCCDFPLVTPELPRRVIYVGEIEHATCV